MKQQSHRSPLPGIGPFIRVVGGISHISHEDLPRRFRADDPQFTSAYCIELIGICEGILSIITHKMPDLKVLYSVRLTDGLLYYVHPESNDEIRSILFPQEEQP